MRSSLLRLLNHQRIRHPLLARGKSTKVTTHSTASAASSANSQREHATPAATGDKGNGDVQVDEQQQHKLPTREPLVKNFFIGSVDKELLAYPEVIFREEMTNLQNALLPLKNYFEESKDHQQGQNFKQLGLYGLNVPTEYDGGRGYGWSASLMASEPDSEQTNLALELQTHRVVVDLLRDVGSTQQQERYLSALAQGDLIGTEAIYEYNPPEDDYFNTQAKFVSETNRWTLQGEKAFVICPAGAPGQRQLFVVLAQTQQPNVPGLMGRGSTIFLVESDHPGVRLGKAHETFGYRDAEMRSVHFDNVQLSDDQIIGLPNEGNRYSEHLVRASRLRGSQLGISLAKRLLQQMTQYSLDTTQCGTKIKDLELTRAHLSRAMCSVYAMDSMLYLTAGLLDEFQGQDVTLESAITKYYTIKQLYTIATQNLSIIGPKSLHKDQTAELEFRNAAQLYTLGESMDTLGMFIALSGLQHAGQALNAGVIKSRNPLFHPGHIFGKFFDSASIENPKTKMQLSDHVHPTLDPAAQCIEHSIARLHMAVDLMLTRHGNSVVERQNEMQRLAEIATLIYAMWACVARSSRSYCIGLPLADHELLTASAICTEGKERVKTLCTEIFEGNFVNNDNNLLRLSNQVAKSKGYFAVHPLTFNF
ncbi:uncharacterized protein Dwil_GK22223, isoform A [Drosophila willistoni]|uniref:Uncharacterized protein, isoform A n=1 Tax=Drosophila willistoni TaxID=7260 RepID=B4MYH7_DROWI|nr:complex I assembly factor ACAD9, mitochondrial isoform X1 [Drosophila willistoni]EDW77166.1 uncharacterized protein Dwil_GK22223, isoform A [Drosophila willistoni]